MPGSPLFGECHGGIPFAKHFRNSIHQLGELLNLSSGKILTKPRMQSPSRFDFVAGDIGHDTDELDFVACLSSRRAARARRGRTPRCRWADVTGIGRRLPLRIAVIAGIIAVAHRVAALVICGLSQRPVRRRYATAESYRTSRSSFCSLP